MTTVTSVILVLFRRPENIQSLHKLKLALASVYTLLPLHSLSLSSPFDSPSRQISLQVSSLLLPHTGDQFVLPTVIQISGIHHFWPNVMWMCNVSSNKNFTSPLRKKVEACPQIHLSSSSSSVYSIWAADAAGPCGALPKVFHHSVAKCEGEKRVHSKTPSWYQLGRWSGQEDLQHVVYLGLKKSGGLPGGCAGDQYYTRVELDLELSARLPWQRPTWNPLNIYFLSTELTDKWMKWEGKEQLSSLFLISAHFSSCLSLPPVLAARRRSRRSNSQYLFCL